eukprot:853340_1
MNSAMNRDISNISGSRYYTKQLPDGKTSEQMLEVLHRVHAHWKENCRQNQSLIAYPDNAAKQLTSLYAAIKQDNNALIFGIDDLRRYNFNPVACPYLARKIKEFAWP